MDWTTGLMISAAIIVGLKLLLAQRKASRQRLLARLAAQGAADALVKVMTLPSLAERISLAKRLQKHYGDIHKLTIMAEHSESEAYYRGAYRSVETYLEHVEKDQHVQ